MTGYEPIVIDGIDCEIGWTSTDYGDCCEEHWAVLRHGCEIGKSIDRDAAIGAALRTLRQLPSAWLREPCPEPTLIEKIEYRIAAQRDELECWGSASYQVTQLLTSEIEFLQLILAEIKSRE